MCGIVGTIGRRRSDMSDRLQRMLNAIGHRGPDQNGVWTRVLSSGQEIALGHTRLSIIDLSEAGRQPMIDEETGSCIAFNGEIYNYREIRAELLASGYSFHSESDTEVLLKAYRRWGIDFVPRLRGMFAFVIHDPETELTHFVRDRLGIKPLYVARSNGRLVFASEVRAILASQCVDRILDQHALAAYLWHGFVPGPRTIVRGIQLLEPASRITVDANGEVASEQRYWAVPAHEPIADQDTAISSSLSELEQAVELRLVSDVPLGVFLSGGVDSSVIASMAQRSSSDPINTFNIGFDERGFDESSYARQVANALGTEHHEITLTEAFFRQNIDAALQSLDQPTFDALNTYFVSRAVRESGITVALSGAGGDELFGGYKSFVDLPRALRILSMMRAIPKGVLDRVARTLLKLFSESHVTVPPQTRWGKLADVLGTEGDLKKLYQVAYALFTRELHGELQLRPSDSVEWGLYHDREALLTDLVGQQPPLAATTALELATFISERLLRDTDSASMAVSLEVRVPLLDHRFIESLSGLSLRNRYLPLGEKHFLLRSLEQSVPMEVFQRPKAGFEIPFELWCKRGLVSRMQETFGDADLVEAVGLNAKVVQNVWIAFQRGAKGLYWTRIWALYSLLEWCKTNQVYASVGEMDFPCTMSRPLSVGQTN